jgi:hypothetical protein
MDIWAYGHLDLGIKGHVAVMPNMNIYICTFSVVDPKLFFFGSGSGFGLNFGSGFGLLEKSYKTIQSARYI